MPATAKPSLDGDKAPPQPGKVPSIPAGMLREGPTAPFLIERLPLPPAKLQWECEKKTLLEKPGREFKTSSPGICPQHPQPDAIPLPQESALLYYGFSKVSLSSSYSFERSSCSPSSPFCSKFSRVLWCWLFFFFFFSLQQAYLLIFHTGQSNMFCTCGDLHLQDPRGSPPSLLKRGGRIRGQKNA